MNWPWFRPIPWYTKIGRIAHSWFNYVFRSSAVAPPPDMHIKYLLDDIQVIWDESRDGALIKDCFKEIIRRMEAEE